MDLYNCLVYAFLWFWRVNLLVVFTWNDIVGSLGLHFTRSFVLLPWNPNTDFLYVRTGNSAPPCAFSGFYLNAEILTVRHYAFLAKSP